MTEDAAFLQAILDRPDDDTPRLIYADWLEEHGNGPRAEFIRVQIALVADPTPSERTPLNNREDELLQAYRDAWLAELPRLDGVAWVRFQRGFVDAAQFYDVEAFQTQAAHVFAAAPIQEAYFRSLLPEALEAFKQQPMLKKLRSLIAPNLALTSGGIIALATSKYLSGMLEILVPGNHIGDDGAIALAESPYLQRLRDLDLRDNVLTDVGVAALAGSANLAHLERLQLVNNQIGNRGLIALAQSPHLTNLKDLYLNHNQIGSSGVIALASSPLLTANLVELDLRNNLIDSAGALALAASPGFANLKDLRLTGQGPSPIDNAAGDALRHRFGRRVRV